MIAVDVPVPLCFQPVERGRFVLFLRADYQKALTDLLCPLDTLWNRLTRSTPVARGRGEVARWPLPGRSEGVVLRRYSHGGLLGGLLGERFWGMTRPVSELALTEQARERSVAVPLPLGVVIERLVWPACRAVFLSAEVTDSEDLVHFCCRMSQDPPDTAARELRNVLTQAARQVRTLHDAGICHADLHLKNLLLHHDDDGEPRVSLIDLDKARERDPRGRGFRLSNLMRLARSVRKLRVAQAVVGPREQLRFLREYLKGIPDGRKLLKDWQSKLLNSGRWREGWWVAIGAERDLRGDRMDEKS